MTVVQFIAPGMRLAFSAELEPCNCERCNRLAIAEGGARQLRAPIIAIPESNTPAVAPAGVSALQPEPENARDV